MILQELNFYTPSHDKYLHFFSTLFNAQIDHLNSMRVKLDHFSLNVLNCSQINPQKILIKIPSLEWEDFFKRVQFYQFRFQNDLFEEIQFGSNTIVMLDKDTQRWVFSKTEGAVY
jgi:hypothetical protein